MDFFWDNWLAYFSFSRGQKEPNREDFEASTNQTPKSEKLNDFELSIGNKNSNYSWRATSYFMGYKDQLVLTGKINDVGAYTRTNIPNSYRAGIELEATATIKSWLTAAANISFSRNKIVDFTEYIDDYDNGGQQINNYSLPDIAFSPNCVGGATVNFLPMKNFELSLISKYVSKQYLDNTQNETRKLNSFYIQDVRMSYAISNRYIKEVKIILQAANILNKLYEPNGYTFSYLYNQKLTTENYYYPMAGINFMLGINLKF